MVLLDRVSYNGFNLFQRWAGRYTTINKGTRYGEIKDQIL